MPLINRTNCRAAVLEAARIERNGKFKRVSAGYLDSLDRRIRRMILDDVRRHPARGQTIRENEL